MDSWISIIHLDPIHIYHLLYGFNWIGSYNPWTIYMKPIMIRISILPPLVLAHKTIACGLYSLKWLLYCTWASFLSLRLSFLSEIYLKFGSTGIKRRLWHQKEALAFQTASLITLNLLSWPFIILFHLLRSISMWLFISNVFGWTEAAWRAILQNQ